jgi:hypothetical protein
VSVISHCLARPAQASARRQHALDESVVLISKGVNRHIETAARVARLHAAAKNGETGFERGDLVCSAEPCGSFLEPTQDLGGFAERIERRSRVLDDIRSEPDMKSDRNAGPEGEG